MDNAHVCTLFEGNYHYGLGSLINSLHSSGFSGTLWIGYRGELPGWLEQFQFVADSQTYIASKVIRLVFLKLETATHFTMYKPDFMLELIETRIPDASCLFYFDPDIVIKAKWAYFENWVRHGVALCEDVNSPLSETSPLRLDWKMYFSAKGINLRPKDGLYVNGGFVGVSAQSFSFLKEWKAIQDTIGPDFPKMSALKAVDRSHLFNKLDQDALNVAKDATNLPISVANKDSMDFAPGGSVMSHAIGRPKPWEKNFVKELLVTGNRPTKTDRLFFEYVREPADIYRGQQVKHAMKFLNLKVATMLGRLIGS